MIESKGHRVDAREVLTVEKMLLAWHTSAFSVKIRGQCTNDGIQNGNCRHLDSTAAFLQQLPKRVVDQSKEDDARICLDPRDHSVDLAAFADHTPDMFDRLSIVKLNETGPRHGVNRLSGGIRNKMQVKTGQFEPACDDRFVPKALCITL